MLAILAPLKLEPCYDLSKCGLQFQKLLGSCFFNPTPAAVALISDGSRTSTGAEYEKRVIVMTAVQWASGEDRSWKAAGGVSDSLLLLKLNRRGDRP